MSGDDGDGGDATGGNGDDVSPSLLVLREVLRVMGVCTYVCGGEEGGRHSQYTLK